MVLIAHGWSLRRRLRVWGICEGEGMLLLRRIRRVWEGSAMRDGQASVDAKTQAHSHLAWWLFMAGSLVSGRRRWIYMESLAVVLDIAQRGKRGLALARPVHPHSA